MGGKEEKAGKAPPLASLRKPVCRVSRLLLLLLLFPPPPLSLPSSSSFFFWEGELRERNATEAKVGGGGREGLRACFERKSLAEKKKQHFLPPPRSICSPLLYATEEILSRLREAIPTTGKKGQFPFSMGARVSLAILKERRRKEAKRKKVITESKADSRLIIIMGKKNENEERGKKKNQSRPFAEERIQ